MEDFHNYLQELADLKQMATIKYRDVDGGIAIIKARVMGFDTEGGRDMIDTDAGFAIGKDQIIEINGRSAEKYC